MSEIILPEKGKVIKKGAYKTGVLGDVRIADKTTKIGEEAFWCNGTITSVSIPACVEEIGSKAFAACENLAKVEIAEGTKLKAIPYSCFSATKIESMVIPEGIEEIEAQAFRKCAMLKSVQLPSSVKTIDRSAFADCPLLSPIVIDGKLLCFSAATAKTEIPSGVKTVGERVFFSNDAIEEVTVPEGVEEIEESAFYGSDNLRKVVLPSSLKKIGAQAFYDCKALADVNIPAGAEIADDAFTGCDALTKAVRDAIAGAASADGSKIVDEQFKGNAELTEFTVPQGVTEIGESAFEGCVNLVKVEIPEGVTGISFSAFRDCTSLKEIVIPASCTDIVTSQYLFHGCASLERVTFKGAVNGLPQHCFEGCASLETVIFEGGVSNDDFRGHVWNCWAFKGCKKLSPAIPEGVTEIFSNAFEDCDFTEIEIPASVKTVCSEAFLNCASLASVTYHEKTDVERGAFAGCPKKLKKNKVK